MLRPDHLDFTGPVKSVAAADFTAADFTAADFTDMTEQTIFAV
jgi:hypothetical protein